MDESTTLAPMHQDSQFHAAKDAQGELDFETITTMPNEQISGLNFANFNQDYSCISVGYENGFRIFNSDPFTQCYERIDGSIGIVEMLFCSSLLAIVGTGEQSSLSPRRLKIINTKRNTTICELTFPTSILAIRMNRERLIVLLEEVVYIYDITNMRLLHTVEIPPNPTGLISLSINTENNFLAYPSPQKISKLNNNHNLNQGIMNSTNIEATNINGQNQNSSVNNKIQSHDDLSNLAHDPSHTQNIRNGDVIIFDCKSLQPITVIDAHKTHLAAMAFSHDGKLLATASDKGTIVRVFSVQTGLKLYQFRRGTYNTKIYSLAFSPSNMFLIASSATGTVHVFRLGEEEAKNTIIKSKGSSGWLNTKKNANDKDLEITRQEELDRLMKNRQTHLELNADDDAGTDRKNSSRGESISNFNKRGIHSDSEDDIDGSSDGEDVDENEADVTLDYNDDDDKSQGNSTNSSKFSNTNSRNNSNNDNPHIIHTVNEDDEETEYENIDSSQPVPLSENNETIKGSSDNNTDNNVSESATSFVSASFGGITKSQPIVDNNRRSVARMLRRTSQSLGRKAAEKMGTYLPPKFSSILEPNRHFASFKVPTNRENMTIVGVIETTIDTGEEIPRNNSILQDDVSSTYSQHSLHSMPSLQSVTTLSVDVQILVVSAEGTFYKYRLDASRGGDCVLLSQSSLVE
jgi:autophagy-related protein 18